MGEEVLSSPPPAPSPIKGGQRFEGAAHDIPTPVRDTPGGPPPRQMRLTPVGGGVRPSCVVGTGEAQ
jgi:hypothetical protein